MDIDRIVAILTLAGSALLLVPLGLVVWLLLNGAPLFFDPGSTALLLCLTLTGIIGAMWATDILRKRPNA